MRRFPTAANADSVRSAAVAAAACTSSPGDDRIFSPGDDHVKEPLRMLC
jgi:hypothetical protein